MSILYLNMNFKISLSIFNKNNAVILIGITLNLYAIGGRITYLQYLANSSIYLADFLAMFYSIFLLIFVV